mmetsp:Transcript_98781/g.189610  ORF Transcript_98781/g.189610 Transcript_98781/m.189610 type:complete len:280 (+) Transcript_98781:1-840(+)
MFISLATSCNGYSVPLEHSKPYRFFNMAASFGVSSASRTRTTSAWVISFLSASLWSIDSGEAMSSPRSLPSSVLLFPVFIGAFIVITLVSPIVLATLASLCGVVSIACNILACCSSSSKPSPLARSFCFNIWRYSICTLRGTLSVRPESPISAIMACFIIITASVESLKPSLGSCFNAALIIASAPIRVRSSMGMLRDRCLNLLVVHLMSPIVPETSIPLAYDRRFISDSYSFAPPFKLSIFAKDASVTLRAFFFLRCSFTALSFSFHLCSFLIAKHKA